MRSYAVVGLSAIPMVVAAASVATAQPQGFIKTGLLTGSWKGTLDGATPIDVTLDGSAMTLQLGSQVLKLTRDGTTTRLEATGRNEGIVQALGRDGATRTVVKLTIEGPARLSGSYEITEANGRTVTGTIECNRPQPKPPAAWTPTERTSKELAEFDPGPPRALAEHIATFAEIDKLGLYNQGNAWINWGPKWYRGRAGTGEARVLVIASDPGPDEAIVGRTLVGDAGKRVQGLLTKIGLDRSYVLANAHPYAVFPGKASSQGLKILENPDLAAWRNEYYSKLVGPGDHLQAIVALGGQAQKALELWTTHPDVPVFNLPHPSNQDEAATLRAWGEAVPRLRRIVTPDAGVDPGANYGTRFNRANDYAEIPRRDLPFGALYFAGEGGLPNFASRPNGDPDRRFITIKAPYIERGTALTRASALGDLIQQRIADARGTDPALDR